MRVYATTLMSQSPLMPSWLSILNEERHGRPSVPGFLYLSSLVALSHSHWPSRGWRSTLPIWATRHSGVIAKPVTVSVMRIEYVLQLGPNSHSYARLSVSAVATRFSPAKIAAALHSIPRGLDVLNEAEWHRPDSLENGRSEMNAAFANRWSVGQLPKRTPLPRSVLDEPGLVAASQRLDDDDFALVHRFERLRAAHRATRKRHFVDLRVGLPCSTRKAASRAAASAALSRRPPGGAEGILLPDKRP